MSALCILPHRDDKPAGEAEVGQLCGWHRLQLDRLVNDIRDLDQDLNLLMEAGTAPKQQSANGGRSKGNPNPPAPANLDFIVLHDRRSHSDVDSVDDRADQPAASIELMTEANATRVRDERRLTRIVLRPVRQPDGSILEVPTTVPALVPRSYVARLDMLVRHHDWIAAQDWVGDYWDELHQLRNSMRGAVRDKPFKRVGSCYLMTPVDITDQCGCDCHTSGGAFRLPCDTPGGCGHRHTEMQPCGGRLMQENGSDVVKCRKDRSHTWETAAELARLEIALNGTQRESA